jgi:hypothetical protein
MLFMDKRGRDLLGSKQQRNPFQPKIYLIQKDNKDNALK